MNFSKLPLILLNDLLEGAIAEREQLIEDKIETDEMLQATIKNIECYEEELKRRNIQ